MCLMSYPQWPCFSGCVCAAGTVPDCHFFQKLGFTVPGAAVGQHSREFSLCMRPDAADVSATDAAATLLTLLCPRFDSAGTPLPPTPPPTCSSEPHVGCLGLQPQHTCPGMRFCDPPSSDILCIDMQTRALRHVHVVHVPEVFPAPLAVGVSPCFITPVSPGCNHAEQGK